jgi:hypothetical protein
MLAVFDSDDGRVKYNYLVNDDGKVIYKSHRDKDGAHYQKINLRIEILGDKTEIANAILQDALYLYREPHRIISVEGMQVLKLDYFYFEIYEDSIVHIEPYCTYEEDLPLIKELISLMENNETYVKKYLKAFC